MKRQSALVAGALTAAVVCSVFAFAQERELPRVDPGHQLETAADFRLADLHGLRMQLSKIEAPVVVLHFWSKYRDCKYDLEVLQGLHKKYGVRGVKIVGVVFSSGTREEIGDFVSELGVDFPNLMCTNKVRNAYDVSTFPTTFLLDSQKRIRYWMYGILVDEHWERLIGELLDQSSKNE